ncbi:MAG: hypothetical protein RLZZ127_2905 [Planctomycetota bacterium]|jgi:uncharacterized protein YbcC (UPF0753/DUF2309 family)
MTMLTDTPTDLQPALDHEALVRQVCLAVAPIWSLRDLVAVNPYQGFAHLDPVAAEEVVRRRLHAAVLPPWAMLRSGFQGGAFSADDVAAARTAADAPAPAPDAGAILARLADAGWTGNADAGVRSIAAQLAALTGTDWPAALAEDLGRFLAARYDQGVARWALPDLGGLWTTWRAWMRHDRALAARGAGAAAAAIQALPADAAAARAALIRRLDLGPAALEDYLGRLLGELPGWSGWLRQRTWPAAAGEPGELPDLLTIRLAQDLALAALTPGLAPQVPADPDGTVVADRAARLVVVAAWERAVRRRIAAGFRPVAATAARPAMQAVLCIDVRSEGLRRALEAADDGIETYGFAGFFAMPVAVPEAGGARPQCPVLLPAGPAVALQRPAAPALGRIAGAVRRSAAGGFAAMETLGLGSAFSLAAGALGLGGRAHRHDEDGALAVDHLPLDERLALLKGMLANLGLGAPHARLVLLCGHDSSTANNPQAGGLACGACGGHSGAVNARVAARLYNDPALRRLLAESAPPADSVAVAGVHDTTTDEVRICDRALVPASHGDDLARLERALAAAGASHRARRAAGLAGLPGGDLLAALRARGTDWAEVRPEWGLAGNAAFIAAPRALTAGADLGGRCFLHSYDEARDPTGAVLQLILTAPVVVASWINLQYWASTVDPARLGSGDKLVHSITGGIGVSAGGRGDLLPGLAYQSVHDGAKPRHEPLRLQVIVAAQAERIDAVVAGHAHLRDLVERGWIGLHRVDPTTGAIERRIPAGSWAAEAA